jgi:hypothetical protein
LPGPGIDDVLEHRHELERDAVRAGGEPVGRGGDGDGARDGVRMPLGQVERQEAAHREPGYEDGVADLPYLGERRLYSRGPVGVRPAPHVDHVRPVSREPGPESGNPFVRQVLAHEPHAGRGPREPVDQKATSLPTLEEERLTVLHHVQAARDLQRGGTLLPGRCLCHFSSSGLWAAGRAAWMGLRL